MLPDEVEGTSDLWFSIVARHNSSPSFTGAEVGLEAGVAGCEDLEVVVELCSAVTVSGLGVEGDVIGFDVVLPKSFCSASSTSMVVPFASVFGAGDLDLSHAQVWQEQARLQVSSFHWLLLELKDSMFWILQGVLEEVPECEVFQQDVA